MKERVADPAYGKHKFGRAEFEKKWNGIILTVEPTEFAFKNKDMLDLVENHKEENASLYKKFYQPVVKPRKKLLLQIFGLTFLLQITGLAVPLFTQVIVDQVLVHQNQQLLYCILLFVENKPTK